VLAASTRRPLARCCSSAAAAPSSRRISTRISGCAAASSLTARGRSVAATSAKRKAHESRSSKVDRLQCSETPSWGPKSPGGDLHVVPLKIVSGDFEQGSVLGACLTAAAEAKRRRVRLGQVL
jgi:hypothetical protein